jgi:hypothetical protein
MSAEVKAETRGFFPAGLRRTHAIAGDADAALLLAEKIKRLDCLLGQTDDPPTSQDQRLITAQSAALL